MVLVRLKRITNTPLFALLTLGACVQRGLQYSVCVCVCVTSLTATPLTYRYKVRYESQANAVLKVFDSWVSLEIFCSKVMVLFAYHDDPWHFCSQ